MKLKSLIKESVWDKIKSNSDHIGKVGKREILYNLTVYKVNTFEGGYGTTYMYIMYDKDFNLVLYKGGFLSKNGNSIDDKKEHTIECKIKSHDKFKEIKQTVIQRPKVL